ncbi:MAG TPA: hypothetical protein VM537_08595 [Anaerolineae bacterium]|nr:hypothetical protein [Anaerolineae bacterium]
MPARARIADEAMIRMYRRGVTTADLGRLYGCSANTIAYALRRAGEQLRPGGGARSLAVQQQAELIRCQVCEILLDQAPPGDEALCGYCIHERR